MESWRLRESNTPFLCAIRQSVSDCSTRFALSFIKHKLSDDELSCELGVKTIACLSVAK